MRIGRNLLLLMSLVLLGGCLSIDQHFSSQMAEAVESNPQFLSRLNCFLVLKDNEGPAIRLEVTNLEILADGLWRPLTKGPVTIDSTAIGAGQVLLGGMGVPPGHYQRLRMTISGGRVQTSAGGFADITTAPFVVEMSLSAELTLDAEDSRTLLVTWDVENSLLPDNSVHPAMAAAVSLRQQLLDLVFVTCPNIDTVFVVRADKNWVVDSFGLRGRPTYLAVDPDSSRQNLYVLTSGDGMVKVVDLSSYRVVDFFPVPLNDAPTFMTINPDGTEAFLLDEHSGYLSRMDLTTGRIKARVLLGYQPKYMAFLNDQNLLAVSLSLSQRVLFLDPTTLGTVGTVSTGGAPSGLAVANGQLYIAESDDNTVAVVDPANRTTLSRFSVGFGPRRMLGIDGQIYVSNFQEGSLSVLVPGQLGVVQQVIGLGRPREMVFDQFYRRLYVADEEKGTLAVVNTNSNLLQGEITLGAKPLGLVVVQ